MKVPLFDMAAELAQVRREVDAAIARVLDSGVLVGGPEVVAFERELAAATRAGHAIGVSSGTDALHAVFLALGLGRGDEVITTPLTFFATAGGAARLGARIVFADVEDGSLTLDPGAAASAVSDRTRAIVPVHLFGRPAALPDVAGAGGCAIVEDAAQSLGAGPPRGLAAAVSFFPTKNLGALGDAGAVLTHDAALADRIALLRTHGARPKYHHLAIGGNFRLDALHAAVLRAKLPYLPAWTAARRSHAERYRALFAATRVPPELRLPAPHPAHVYHQFVIRAPRRDALRAHLAGSGIGTEIYYPEPLHLQPCFAELGYRAGAFPIAERACREVLALPIHPTLTSDAQAMVVERIAAFYR
ncbi:MAG TPA: DegT/DnrJ/EryC1/StrS family aminotransferase [Kofleriaceae bacterium]|nr:DegT/DnrJ/EryC1/StrS family aminotransferase [Kofleriaceae bacterium]